MNPVAPQDRPKMVLLIVGIAVALVFVIHNLLGTKVLARPSQPQQIASMAPPASAHVDRSASGTREAGGVDGTDEPAFASPSTINHQPSTHRSANSRPATPAGAAEPVQPWVPDPFHPIAHPTVTGASAGSPAPAATAACPASAPPVLPGPVNQPADPEVEPVMAAVGPPAPPPVSKADGPASRPRRAATELASVTEAAPAGPVTLTGTVGSGASAVAMFRVGDDSLFLRPQELVAGWRLTRIQVGQVWLSRQGRGQLVHAGESLGNGSNQANQPAALPAG